MDWVLVFSLQWVVGGTAPAPTALTNVGYQTEQLCKTAADAMKAEGASPLASVVVTYVRATCVQRLEVRGLRTAPTDMRSATP